MKRKLVKRVVNLREKLFAAKHLQEAENPTKEPEELPRETGQNLEKRKTLTNSSNRL